MSIVISIFLLLLGLWILMKGGDYLVEGASAGAKRLNIAPIVIGLTVVAFGTSAPELVVSITSAIRGSTDIALGNIVGSNIANFLLILGLSAFIYPITIRRNTVWKEIPFSLLGAVVVVILGLQSLIDTNQSLLSGVNDPAQLGKLTLSNGLILLTFFVIFMYYVFGISKTAGSDDEAPQIQDLPLWKILTYVFGGLVALTLSSRLVVDNAIFLAQQIGVSENLIGLTIVAVGTSLPELVTSVTAALKKNSDIAIGNIVGSNIFNIFFILGTTLLISPIPLSGLNIFDLFVLLATTLFLFSSVFIFKQYRLGKVEGASMIVLYILYTAFLIWRG